MIILLLLVLIGCGQEYNDERSPPTVYVDPKLADLVNQWRNDMAIQHINEEDFSDIGTIAEGNLEQSQLGLCEYKHRRIITIEPGLPPATLKTVLYHELGHCALNQVHWGTFESIMHATLFVSDEFWNRIWEKSHEEYAQHIFEEQQNDDND